jgi:hypothetical protein
VLTDDQRAALEQTRSDYRDRINNAPPDQRRELYREMSEKIRQVTQPTDNAEPAGGD